MLRTDTTSLASLHSTGTPRFTAFCFIVCHRYIFSQIEGKTPPQQKDYDLLYCNIHLIVVVWKQPLIISEVYL